MNQGKVILIGLDGATFDVLEPLAEEGKIPYLKKMMDIGATGELESTFPPLTAPAWLALATGKSPGKTGVIDFFYRTNESPISLEAIGSEFFRKHGSIWDYLDLAGLKQCIFNYPLLYPPYQINGYMISGVGSSEETRITYPPDLIEELNRIANGYQIVVPYNNLEYVDNEELFLKHLKELLNKNEKVINYLLKKEKWDFFVVVLSATDYLQHYMWKHWDHFYPGHTSKVSKKYREEFIAAWTQIDQIIGNLYQQADDKTSIFIVSDHGFGPQDKVFYLNSWLEKEGYLARTINLIRMKELFRSISKDVLRKRLVANIVGFLAQKAFGHSTEYRERSIRGSIDLGQSKAVALDYSNTFGGIHILDYPNKKRLIEEITGKLNHIKVETEGLFRIMAYPSDKKYHGNALELLPDILVSFEDFSGLIITKFGRKILEHRPYSHLSGTHTMNGILIAVGPNIVNKKIHHARIYDIAPTLLYLFDHSVPDDIDGRVLAEIFEPLYLREHQIDYSCSIRNLENGITQRNDSKTVKENLKTLGYL